MKNILTAVFLLLFTIMVSAQGHTFKECYLNKNFKPNTESDICPACKAKKAKEKAAREAEDARRSKAVWQKGAEKRLADDRAFEAEQARKRAESGKPKSGEVVINAQPNRLGTSPPPVKKTTAPAGAKRYLRTTGDNEFLDLFSMEKVDNVSGFSYKAYQGAWTEGNDESQTVRANFPANTGVVTVLDEKVDQTNHSLYCNCSYSPAEYQVYDIIVGEKQQRVFNSDSISGIDHIYGNWFLIGTKGYSNVFGSVYYENAGFFNLASGKFVAINERTYNGNVSIRAMRNTGIIQPNLRFASGKYIDTYFPAGGDVSAPIKRRDPEKLLDDKVGGPMEWKSMVYIVPSRYQGEKSYEGFLYYVDANDEIQKVSVSSQEFWDFLQ
jgi:hypothetical protein